MPSRVILKGPIITIDSPYAKKRLNRAVRKKSHRNGRRDLTIEETDIRATRRQRIINPRGIIAISGEFINKV